MNHSRNLLTRRLQAVPHKFTIAVLCIALLGFADAAYLTIKHYAGVVPPCAVGGCEQVLTSDYATLLGIPVALMGALFYVLILVGTFAYLESKQERLFRWVLYATLPGFVFTVYLFILQAVVIESFCLYCLGSATTSTLLAGLAIYIFSKYSGAPDTQF
ncbi:MAG: vitamin K epoxide reductase family protein [Patescibacteria group bacterium]